MATVKWEGKADLVAQVTTIAITAFDAATTYIVTINGNDVSVIGNTSDIQTASDLADAIAVSTNPYFAALVAVNNASATVTITGLPGLPYTITSSVSGGTGTIGAPSIATQPTGPNFWDDGDNWDTGVVPVSTDDVVIENSAISILWNIDQNAVALASLNIKKTFTGRIGLDSRRFTTSADGINLDASKPEYRDFYLQISSTIVNIGEHAGQDTPVGSGRINIDLGTGASTITVADTASATLDAGRPAAMILNVNIASDVFVTSAPGGFGIAVDSVGEVSTVNDVTISQAATATRVEISAGVTLNGNYFQSSGTGNLDSAATVAAVEVIGGVFTSSGDYTITAATVRGGTANFNHVKTAGDAITTLNVHGGTVSATGSQKARTWATVNLFTPGGVLQANNDFLTITTLNEPTQTYKVAITGA